MTRSEYPTRDTADSSDEYRDCFELGMRSKGFEAGEPVHEWFDCFTLEDSRRSLFESSYTHGIPVTLSSHGGKASLPVVITLAEARYIACFTRARDTPGSCREAPDWYFEGYVLNRDAPWFELFRVRIYVYCDLAPRGRLGEIFLWQRIPADPDPVGRIVTAAD